MFVVAGGEVKSSLATRVSPVSLEGVSFFSAITCLGTS
jgi:hypothetical protein